MHRLCAVLAIIVACTNAPCQQSSDKAEAPTCCYSELYRKEGWVIPGLKGAKSGYRVAVPDKHGVYLTKLEPTANGATIQKFTCSREHAGRVEIEDLNVGIINLTSFDVGGHIFAYNLVYGIAGIGTEWSVRFYDLDGSGRFTLRRSERNRFVPELIPDWVEDSSKNSTEREMSRSFLFTHCSHVQLMKTGDYTFTQPNS